MRGPAPPLLLMLAAPLSAASCPGCPGGSLLDAMNQCSYGFRLTGFPETEGGGVEETKWFNGLYLRDDTRPFNGHLYKGQATYWLQHSPVPRFMYYCSGGAGSVPGWVLDKGDRTSAAASGGCKCTFFAENGSFPTPSMRWGACTTDQAADKHGAHLSPALSTMAHLSCVGPPTPAPTPAPATPNPTPHLPSCISVVWALCGAKVGAPCMACLLENWAALTVPGGACAGPKHWKEAAAHCVDPSKAALPAALPGEAAAALTAVKPAAAGRAAPGARSGGWLSGGWLRAALAAVGLAAAAASVAHVRRGGGAAPCAGGGYDAL